MLLNVLFDEISDKKNRKTLNIYNYRIGEVQIASQISIGHGQRPLLSWHRQQLPTRIHHLLHLYHYKYDDWII